MIERATVLAKALRTDSDPAVRRTAAWGLAQYTTHPVAVDALVAALNSDSDDAVKEMSAWALAGARPDPGRHPGADQGSAAGRAT